jgi:hypothetical protein
MLHVCDDPNRLLELAERAARAEFVEADWRVELLPAPERVRGAVVAYTGYHAVAAAVPPEEVRAALDPADIAAPMNPTFLTWLGQRLHAVVGHVDVVLARFGTGQPDNMLQVFSDPPDNERVWRARRQREGVTYLTDQARHLVVTIGHGLAGRTEISIEIADERQRGVGTGSAAVRSAVGHVPPERPVFASVAAGNTRSLRAFLSAGFRPIGAECLLIDGHA